MRKILFKAKHKDGKGWIDGCYQRLVVHGVMKHFIAPANSLVFDDIKLIDSLIEVDENTISQFTGLTDRNGKEIYEGDICNCSYGYTNDKIGIVYYKYGCFYVDDKHPSGNMPLKSLVKSEANRIEIIGNIHDDPELME